MWLCCEQTGRVLGTQEGYAGRSVGVDYLGVEGGQKVVDEHMLLPQVLLQCIHQLAGLQTTLVSDTAPAKLSIDWEGEGMQVKVPYAAG